MKIRQFFKLIIAIIICEVVGIGGTFFTGPVVSSDWYTSLVKPALNPPAWVFGPVWTTLYALMGIALFLVWSSYAKASEDKKKQKKIALGMFGVQLFLNAIWSIIFFGSTALTINGLNNIGIAFVDIILLWLAIVWTIVVFYKISQPAAYLFVPYILWVSFALYLNYAIWMLN